MTFKEAALLTVWTSGLDDMENSIIPVSELNVKYIAHVSYDLRRWSEKRRINCEANKAKMSAKRRNGTREIASNNIT